jgi:Putative F0F1-ATPase subunit Ca2+/Mg2+ transporter
MKEYKKKPVNNFLKFSGLGLQMMVSIGIGAWLGMKLDQYLELKFPVFLLTFVFVIFGGLMFQLYRSLNKD